MPRPMIPSQAEPPASHSLDDVAGAIGRLLGDINRNLRTAAAAA